MGVKKYQNIIVANLSQTEQKNSHIKRNPGQVGFLARIFCLPVSSQSIYKYNNQRMVVLLVAVASQAPPGINSPNNMQMGWGDLCTGLPAVASVAGFAVDFHIQPLLSTIVRPIITRTFLVVVLQYK